MVHRSFVGISLLHEIFGDVERRQNRYRQGRLFRQLFMNFVQHRIHVRGDFFGHLLVFATERVFRPENLNFYAFAVHRSLLFYHRVSSFPERNLTNYSGRSLQPRINFTDEVLNPLFECLLFFL